MAIFKKSDEQNVQDVHHTATASQIERPRAPARAPAPAQAQAQAQTQTQMKAPAPTQAPPAPQARNVSVIGPTMEFKGELTADEDLIIEGLIVGTIAHHNKHLTVGEKGRVKADVHANTVIVLGQLVGDIHSKGMVSLAKGSDVTGNIFCERISMEDGAKFSGSIDMADSHTESAVIEDEAPAKPAKSKKVRSIENRPDKAS